MGMSETRARRKIREAVEAKGAKVTDLTWEPIGQMVEMSGREGGWTVFAEWSDGREDHALGYSWQDVVEWVDHYWEIEAGAGR
jgi:hypothetical protein